jgi:hypothetical protein
LVLLEELQALGVAFVLLIARFAQRTLDLQAAPLIARTMRSGH